MLNGINPRLKSVLVSLEGALNQEKALVGAFSVIVKTDVLLFAALFKMFVCSSIQCFPTNFIYLIAPWEEGVHRKVCKPVQIL